MSSRSRGLLALGKPMRDFDHGALGVAVEQDVGLGVDQDRAAHLVRPVVVMRDAAQRASMPPSTIGTSLKASRQRWA
jgi:hypothetical protein